MELNAVKDAVTASNKVAARYRDQYGFIVQGVILGVSEDGLILIDAYHNKVKPDDIISLKYL